MEGADLFVKCLEAQGVEFIFGIPGAKIDALFNALVDSKIKVIVCRHEQNAAFMAASYGRLTGRAGVVLVTSGPGVANLTTGLLTATTEGDPIVAIGGSVSKEMALKSSHQSVDNVALMSCVTKKSFDLVLADNIPEVIENAFRLAQSPKSGACFISVPSDILKDKTQKEPFKNISKVELGRASEEQLQKAAKKIEGSKQVGVLLGLEASRMENTLAIRRFLQDTSIPVIGTFQAAGAISRELLDHFIGRVGLFKNQPGDGALDLCDTLITIGFDPVAYDPEIWNRSQNKEIIHINYHPAEIRYGYNPSIDLCGEISHNLDLLKTYIVDKKGINFEKIQDLRKELVQLMCPIKKESKKLMHPLTFIHDLRNAINDDFVITCDIGSVYMWMARYFFSYRPHQLLFSDGQQTLGVALPWAIGAYYAGYKNKLISISGDGGFLFSSMELETAVREKIPLVHCIWTDRCYNMVSEQEMMKYKRKSGVDFGEIDIVSYAKAFGAIGYKIEDPKTFPDVLKEALKQTKPVLIDIPIDYSDNAKLFSNAAKGSEG